MKRKTYLKLLTALALGFGGVGGLAAVGRKTNLLDSSIPVELESGEMEVPVFSRFKLTPGSCSGYARRVASELFGKDFSHANAWDRRYVDNVVCGVETNVELEALERFETLKPGMIVGVFYPRSYYNGAKDMEGNPVAYTHNLVYLGRDKTGELTFAEQFGVNTRTRTLAEFSDHGFEAREIIDCN